jgi:hypothetical protein
MPSVALDGTQTATVGTEHTLATITTAGTYVLQVDTRNMLDGDALELRAFAKTLSADATPTLVESASYVNKQGDGNGPGAGAGGPEVKLSNPLMVVHQGVYTLKQTAGTSRLYPFSVLKV